MILGKTFSKVRKLVSKKAAIVAAVLVVGLGGAVATLQPAQAVKQDCNNNAVIYCGAYSTDRLRAMYDSNASTRAIYAASPFGISSSEFHGSLSSLQTGAVYKNGNVIVNGRVVATNAITAGRQYIPGSTNMNIPGITAYSRPPSVSFKENSLEAFVKLDGAGNFQFAVIKSCGNPVTGKPTQPPAKPGFTVSKKVRATGSNATWAEDVTVKPGDKVDYVISVVNTGNVSLKDVHVHDKLPAGMTYNKYSTYIVTSYYSGKHLVPEGITGSGVNIGDMPVGGTAFLFFTATAPAASNTSLKICDEGTTILHNVAYAKPTGLTEKNDDADVHTCRPRPQNPNFTISKKVKIAGSNDLFAEDVVADPGTLLQYVIMVQNTGNTTLKNVLVKDMLPAGVVYKAGTTTLTNSVGVSNKKLPDTPSLFKEGITLASMKAGETDFIFFQANLPQVNSTNPILKECETGKTKFTNKATAKPEGLTTKEDTADAATCKKTPNFTIVKDVRKKGDTTWRQDVTVNYGDRVEYRIVVKNTGNTDLTNVLVKDNRPVGVDYVAGSLKVNGQSSNADLFGAGVTVPVIKQNAQAEITFEAKLMGQPTPCQSKPFKNIASAKPAGLQPKDDDAVVTANCTVIPHPGVKIVKIVSKPVVDVNGVFTYTLDVTNTGDVALKNATVTDPAPEGVNFLSSSKPTGTTVNLTATNFDATIANLGVGQTVRFEIQSKVVKEVVGKIVNTACVDAKEIPGDKDDCSSVEIKTPKAVCTDLAALSLGDFKYRFTPQIVKSDVVTVTSVTYNFGDGSQTVTQPNANSVEHTFVQTDKEATYTVNAVVTFSIAGAPKTVNCDAQVSISPIPEEPCPYNPDLPKDDPECKPPVDVCPEVPGDQTNPKDCEETPVVPVIPSTGAGDMFGGAAGLSATAYGAVALINKRRTLKNLK